MSISVIYPVHNAQHHLIGDLDRLMESLAELTVEFEILVVDDASTDATDDILSEMARRFPQVRPLRKTPRIGLDAAADFGLSFADGDLLFVLNEPNETQLANLRRLWEERHDEQLLIAQIPTDPAPLGDKLVNRLMRWGAALQETEKVSENSKPALGTQMIKRPVMMRMAERKAAIQVDEDAHLEAIRIADPRDTNYAPQTQGPTNADTTAVIE